jgi:hypothetical protein
MMLTGYGAIMLKTSYCMIHVLLTQQTLFLTFIITNTPKITSHENKYTWK